MRSRKCTATPTWSMPTRPNTSIAIPHGDRRKSVARRVPGGAAGRVSKLRLKAPIEERDEDGTRRADGLCLRMHGVANAPQRRLVDDRDGRLLSLQHLSQLFERLIRVPRKLCPGPIDEVPVFP